MSNKQLFLLTYSNVHWIGPAQYALVWAETRDEAMYLSEEHMDKTMRNLYSVAYGMSLQNDPKYGEYGDPKCFYISSVEPYDGPSTEIPIIGKPS